MLEEKEYFEETEERLKDEINVLAQTVEFNEGLVAEYSKKLINEKENFGEANRKIEILQAEIASLKQEIQALQKERN